MTSGYQVVLDACVLVNAALRDTLLRNAEPPHLYLPRWSKDILLETVRTLETKLSVTPVQTAHLVRELELHFADAWIEGYEPLIAAMTNHPKTGHHRTSYGNWPISRQGNTRPWGGRSQRLCAISLKEDPEAHSVLYST
jgi:hypothetical protein